MADYKTEEEQVEALKDWWKTNGSSMLITVALAVAVVFGWQTWKKNSENQAVKAAMAYQELLTASAAVEEADAKPESLLTAHYVADQLKKDFGKSVYARFAALFKAKYYVAENKLDLAESELDWVISKDSNDNVAELAVIRKARVLSAQQKNADAIALLVASKSKAYAALHAETLGDLYKAEGKNDLALQAYRRANEGSAQSPVLDLKIRDLEPAPSTVSEQES